jgi:hypothetical protein
MNNEKNTNNHITSDTIEHREKHDIQLDGVGLIVTFINL